jgi:hypothetical protein
MIKIKGKALLCLVSLVLIIPSLVWSHSSKNDVISSGLARIIVNGETVEEDEVTKFSLLDDENLQVTLKMKDDENLNTSHEKSRNEVSDYFSRQNRLKTSDLNLPTNTYFAKYGPFVTFETVNTDFELINKLSKSKNVDEVYISNRVELANTVDDSTSSNNIKSNITLNDIIQKYIHAGDTGSNTGLGVSIGILELGLVNPSHPNFVGKNVVVNYRPGVGGVPAYNLHANVVASIASIIAPGSRILSAAIDEVINNTVLEQTDWLISNGANVINNSWGESVPNGRYSGISAYFDYVTVSAKVTMVAATGNSNIPGNPNSGFVTSTAIGRNVIGVGSVVVV